MMKMKTNMNLKILILLLINDKLYINAFDNNGNYYAKTCQKHVEQQKYTF